MIQSLTIPAQIITMPAIEYVTKALTTWSVGFSPYAEVYAAVAAGMALGLDAVSAVFWGVLGNFVPIPLLLWGYDRLMQVPQLRAWLSRLQKRGGQRVREPFKRYGAWFLIPMTPLLGSWTVAIVGPLTGIAPRQLLVFSLVSITLYGVATAIAITTGISWFSAP
ncbi:small multi-drug export protein [Pseudanabaena sp. FACHB-2040]|uniref:small multi-drug export protein n=1 Tax=Pseudanabaena sp. FACHB-2040 TaxID=2692859 RepID=UPI001688B1C9|nr:small multi-drug export protein [Pseudanabaena sp. FACHB-2040]MBD2261201.1 small multi-drug export protein [Pseudanabaena sp. FACHB-2040]